MVPPAIAGAVPACQGSGGRDLRSRRGIAKQASIAHAAGARQRIQRMAEIPRMHRRIPDLAENRAATPE
jgi:hypothetical protein